MLENGVLGFSIGSKMLSLRKFWRRHRTKILISTSILGGGYVLYKLYNVHKSRLADLERELAKEHENDELIKTRMQAHFENIQRIASTTTLPHAMHYLSNLIAEEMDLSHLTEKLMRGKDQPDSLTQSEKLEVWERLKILSFTRLVVSLWSVTMLSLYIRVQVNILGRHLYIDTARGLGSSRLLEDVDLIDREELQKFLASSDFLANHSMPALIFNIQEAVTEVLKGKQLRDFLNTTTLHGTIMQILHMFMGMGVTYQWMYYLMPQDAAAGSSINDTILADTTKFDQLMAEAREVLSSAEFVRVAEICLKVVVDALVDDMGTKFDGNSLTSGMPLAKLVPRVAQMGASLLEEPSENRFIQIIESVPDVELFFTFLYANMPTL